MRNFALSFGILQYVKEYYLSACRLCSMIIFPYSTKQIVVFFFVFLFGGVVLITQKSYHFPNVYFQVTSGLRKLPKVNLNLQIITLFF